MSRDRTATTKYLKIGESVCLSATGNVGGGSVIGRLAGIGAFHNETERTIWFFGLIIYF